MLLLASRRWTAAGAVLGAGFALKLTPVLLLPLALLVADRKRAPHVALAFAVASVLPFVPFIFSGRDGLLYVFSYDAARPLQIESLLRDAQSARPSLRARRAPRRFVRLDQHRGPRTRRLAALSPWLALLAVLLVYVILWRVRARLRAHPPDVAFAALAVVLVAVSLGKVLSPQFLIWVCRWSRRPGERRDRAARRGRACLAAVALTQVEFPRYYHALVRLEAAPIVIVAMRNGLLLAAAILAVVILLKGVAARPAG